MNMTAVELCPECELEECMCHMETVECENCNGSGWEDYAHRGKCAACAGHGYLQVSREDP